MSGYEVHFEWDDQVASHADARWRLDADTIAAAKLAAAVLYADPAFDAARPSAYRILQNGETEVYRYPETAGSLWKGAV